MEDLELQDKIIALKYIDVTPDRHVTSGIDGFGIISVRILEFRKKTLNCRDFEKGFELPRNIVY